MSFLTLLIALNIQAAIPSGIFAIVSGDVFIERNSKQEPAKVGSKLYELDTVTVAEESAAKIIMKDKNVLHLGPLSKVKIKNYTNVSEFLLEQGQLRSEVVKKYSGDSEYKVITPTAISGVRGTDFIMEYNASENETSIAIFRGSVEFGNRGSNGEMLNPVRLRAGQFSQIIRGARPIKPVKKDQAFIQRLKRESSTDIRAPRIEKMKNRRIEKKQRPKKEQVYKIIKPNKNRPKKPSIGK